MISRDWNLFLSLIFDPKMTIRYSISESANEIENEIGPSCTTDVSSIIIDSCVIHVSYMLSQMVLSHIHREGRMNIVKKSRKCRSYIKYSGQLIIFFYLIQFLASGNQNIFITLELWEQTQWNSIKQDSEFEHFHFMFFSNWKLSTWRKPDHLFTNWHLITCISV